MRPARRSWSCTAWRSPGRGRGHRGSPPSGRMAATAAPVRRIACGRSMARGGGARRVRPRARGPSAGRWRYVRGRVGGPGARWRASPRSSRRHAPLTGCVHLASVGVRSGRVADRARRRRPGWASALAVVNALAARADGSPPRLWLVTRGAQRVTPADASASLGAAAVWGLGADDRVRASRTAHDARGSALRIPPGIDVAALAEELLGADTEDQVALRGTTRYAARLVRGAPAAVASSAAMPRHGGRRVPDHRRHRGTRARRGALARRARGPAPDADGAAGTDGRGDRGRGGAAGRGSRGEHRARRRDPTHGRSRRHHRADEPRGAWRA